jgi:hypothetical protein
MWQNGGHSGCDQWNFVLHPVFAAKSCDPKGAYVRAWVPELAGLPDEAVHCPWEATPAVLAAAGPLSLVRFAATTRRGVPTVGLGAGRRSNSTGSNGSSRRQFGGDNSSSFANTYPERVLTDLRMARQRTHDAVMAVRRSEEGQKMMLPCGNEVLQLPPARGEEEEEEEEEESNGCSRSGNGNGTGNGGRQVRIARLITRADYFGDAPVVYQSPAEVHNSAMRRPHSVLGSLLHDETRAWTEKHGGAAGGKGQGGKGNGKGAAGGNNRGGSGSSRRRDDPRFSKRWREGE